MKIMLIISFFGGFLLSVVNYVKTWTEANSSEIEKIEKIEENKL